MVGNTLEIFGSGESKFFVHGTGIWEGGGLRYLNILGEKFPIHTTYYLDSRLRTSNEVKLKGKICYVDSGVIARFLLFLVLRIKCIIRAPGLRGYVARRQRAREQLTYVYLNGLPSLFINRSTTKVVVLFQNRLCFDTRSWKAFGWRYRLKLLILKLGMSILVRKDDIIVVQTYAMKEAVRNLFSPRHLVVLPLNGTGKEYEQSQLSGDAINGVARPGVTDGKVRLFYPSSGIAHKNHKNLFKAMSIIDAAYPGMVRLYVTLSEREALGIDDFSANVIPIGRLSHADVIKAYHAMDFLIFPSICESLGLPLLEAQAAGLSIIASNLDFQRESCQHVLEFNPYSVTSISNAVNKAYHSQLQERL